jgi:hypothetical protein
MVKKLILVKDDIIINMGLQLECGIIRTLSHLYNLRSPLLHQSLERKELLLSG